MQIALNINNERIHIKNSKDDEKYFCPFCGAEMIRKTGNINIHHFAHKNNCICNDHWSHDMSEWHLNWQNKFPVKNQEVVVKHEQLGTHRADVLIDDTVIEFQHSPISKIEFEERNKFYQSCGYRVIWVFDMNEKFLTKAITQVVDENLEMKGFQKFKWKNPSKVFSEVSINDELIIFFEQDLLEDGIRLWNTKSFNIWNSSFVAEYEDYMEDEFLNLVNPEIKPRKIIEICVFDDPKPPMIFKNIRDNRLVKFNQDPYKQWQKYRRVYGVTKYNGYNGYTTRSEEILNFDKKEWVLELTT